jgi:hypothetical protein
MDLHTSSPKFQQVFKSQQTTQLFIDAYKSFVSVVLSTTQVSSTTIRILEKVSHFGLGLALDNCVAGAQKREVFSSHCCFSALFLTPLTDTEHLTTGADCYQPRFC